MSAPILRFFGYAGWRAAPAAAEAGKPFRELAQHIDEVVPDGPEKSAGLRKLLEARDCIVRAVLPPE